MISKPERNLNVLWVAESNFPANSSIKPHTHSYNHLFLVRRGPIEFAVGEARHILDEGESILAKPGVLHGMSRVKSRMVRCYEIKFACANPILSSLPDRFPRDDFAEGLVQELVAESARSRPASPAFAADYLQALINYLYRAYGTPEDSESTTIDTTGFSQVAKDIVKHLENNYKEDLSLQEIADAVGFNKTYICSMFKRVSGMTIGNCLTAIRIRKAAEAISFSDMSLSQVSALSGFTNLSHFNRIFKKVVGIPPGQYRRMYPAEILVPGDSDVNSELLEQKGFITSVLAGKKLTVSDVMAQADWAINGSDVYGDVFDDPADEPLCDPPGI